MRRTKHGIANDGSCERAATGRMLAQGAADRITENSHELRGGAGASPLVVDNALPIQWDIRPGVVFRF